MILGEIPRLALDRGRVAVGAGVVRIRVFQKGLLLQAIIAI